MDLDVVLYIGIAVALYVVAERGVRFLERRTGRRFASRPLLFMAIFLAFLVLALWLLGVRGLPGSGSAP